MRKRECARRGGDPGGADDVECRLDDGSDGSPEESAEEAPFVDVTDGQRLLARLVERQDDVALLLPAGAGFREAGVFRSRKLALAALRAMEGG